MIKRKPTIVIKRRETPLPDIVFQEKYHTYWCNITGGETHCFVCGRKFTDKDKGHKVTIGYHKYSCQKLIRHIKCSSGSLQWSKKFQHCFDENLRPVKLPITIKRRRGCKKTTIINIIPKKEILN